MHLWHRQHAEQLRAVKGDRDAALAEAASATAEVDSLRGALDQSQRTVLQLQVIGATFDLICPTEIPSLRRDIA